ncbi:MAG TPA: hypothetical protein VFS15_07870 [Kofleriaceae bacterium]|nr:hypothetical protein [Kofleriaceae bacterium]
MAVRVAVVALLLAATGCGPPAPPPGKPSWPTLEPTDASYNARVVALRTSLGRAAIALEMRGARETIRSSACTDPEARSNQTGCARCELAGESDHLDEATLDGVRTAFDRYPASFLVASGIERVALCKHIEYEDIQREQLTAGTVDYQQRRLFVSVEPFLGRVYDAAGAFTAEDIVHHELFHLIEWQHMRDEMDDPEWRLQNPIGFEYRAGGADGERPTGFVDAYAASNEIEDRASTFQYLMARPAELCAIAAQDPAVRAKARLIWERVAAIDGVDWLRTRALCGGAPSGE